jgi:cytochrome b561
MEINMATVATVVPSAAPTSPAGRQSAPTMLLHWSTVVMIVVGVVAVLWREAVEDDALRTTLLSVHRQAGNFVLLALSCRVALRFGPGGGLVDHAGALPPVMRWAAWGAHAALYMLLLALPLLGIAASNAHSVSVSLFGLVDMPRLVQPDADLADALTDYHLWASWCLLGLVILHIGAAVWHHVVRRDGVLAAMLPLVRRR